MQRMSTPPFVALPRGVERTDCFVGAHSHLAGLLAYPDSASRGAVLLILATGSKEDFIALIPYLRALGFWSPATTTAGNSNPRVRRQRWTHDGRL